MKIHTNYSHQDPSSFYNGLAGGHQHHTVETTLSAICTGLAMACLFVACLVVFSLL